MQRGQRPYTALYAEFWMRLMKNTFQNKLGTIITAEGADKDMWAINLLLQTPNDKWWDDPATTDKVETRDDILLRSFNEGYAATVAALGKDRSQWRWGTLHAANFVSNPLGASGIGPIVSIVNKQVPTGGNSECVNSEMWMASTGNFAPLSIPSMRMIVDMSDLTKCTGMNSSGESGNPGSDWYGNMIEAWRTVRVPSDALDTPASRFRFSAQTLSESLILDIPGRQKRDPSIPLTGPVFIR